MKVHTVQELQRKLFICESCCLTKGQLRRHLVLTIDCFRFYSEKYSSNSIEDIMKKHNALKRASYPSRLKESRAKENEKMFNNTPLFRSLNNFKLKTSLFNYKLCFVCNSNFSENAVRDIDENEELFVKSELVCESK